MPKVNQISLHTDSPGHILDLLGLTRPLQINLLSGQESLCNRLVTECRTPFPVQGAPRMEWSVCIIRGKTSRSRRAYRKWDQDRPRRKDIAYRDRMSRNTDRPSTFRHQSLLAVRHKCWRVESLYRVLYELNIALGSHHGPRDRSAPPTGQTSSVCPNLTRSRKIQL